MDETKAYESFGIFINAFKYMDDDWRRCVLQYLTIVNEELLEENSNKKKDLKPCPFCGGEAILLVNQMYPEKKSYIECMKCGAKTNEFMTSVEYIKCGTKTDEFMTSFEFSSDDKAIEAWNRREKE